MDAKRTIGEVLRSLKEGRSHAAATLVAARLEPSGTVKEFRNDPHWLDFDEAKKIHEFEGERRSFYSRASRG